MPCSFYVPVGVCFFFFNSILASVPLSSLVLWSCAFLWKLMSDACSPVRSALCLFRWQRWLMIFPGYWLRVLLKHWISATDWSPQHPWLVRGFDFHPTGKGRHGGAKWLVKRATFQVSVMHWQYWRWGQSELRFISGSILVLPAKEGSCLQDFPCEGRTRMGWCQEEEQPPGHPACLAFLARLVEYNAQFEEIV